MAPAGNPEVRDEGLRRPPREIMVAKPCQNIDVAVRWFGASLPLRAKFFIVVVMAAGSVVFAQSLYRTVLGGQYNWLYLAALTTFATFFPIKIPVSRNHRHHVVFALGDVLVFTAILLFGPAVAVCLAAVEGIALTIKVGLKTPYKVLFNISQLTLASYLTAHFFYFIHATSPPLSHAQITNPAMLLFEFGVVGLLYCLLNVGTILAGMTLAKEVSLGRAWKDFKWTAIVNFSSASLGAITFLYFGATEFYYVVLASPMVLLVYYTLKVNQARIRQTYKHLEEVQALLTEKIQAEKELQRAKDSLETRVQQRTYELRQANQRLRVEVNDRKTAQRALAAETERLRVTLRSIGDGVVTTDTSCRVALINDVAEKLTGWTQKKAVGKPLCEVFQIINQRDRTPCEDLCQTVLATGEISTLDGLDRAIVARDGSERSIYHSAAPIRDDAGRINGVVLVFRDITDEQRLERELLKAQKLESLGILAGGIAHDFNNILAGILLKTQLAQRAVAKGREPTNHLASIHDAVHTATTLTQQLLTFAKGGAPIKQTSSIGELVKESANFALRGSRIRCEMQIPNDLWAAEVDKGQISQVVHNLVINAAQSMPEGGTIAIRAENARVAEGEVGDLPPGIYTKVVVIDEGCGIRPEDITSIFDPYFSTKPTGHGLGLTTTHSIIKRHSGHIEVESEVGRGSRFSLYLPASRRGAETAPADEESKLEAAGGRVLIMDDEARIRESLGEVLEELGYEVGFSADGAQALSIYEKAMKTGEPYDVVIMDLTIPGGMGGREAVKKLLELDSQARAVVYSGYSKDPVMAAYREHGFRAMLPKPFKFEQLAGILCEVMQEPAVLEPGAKTVGPNPNETRSPIRLAG